LSAGVSWDVLAVTRIALVTDGRAHDQRSARRAACNMR
jgi:hypothetical protein